MTTSQEKTVLVCYVTENIRIMSRIPVYFQINNKKYVANKILTDDSCTVLSAQDLNVIERAFEYVRDSYLLNIFEVKKRIWS